MNTTLQDSTFKQLRDFIYEKSGIFMPDTKKYLLENRLAGIIQKKNLDNFEDYLYLIRYGKNGDELSSLFDAITVNETYFMREPQQLNVLVDNIAPMIIEKKKIKNLRIWSAACSTGEEPYTIVMLLAEKNNLSAEVLASDISDEAIDYAKKATYSSYSVRNVPKIYLTKYFKENGQTYMFGHSAKNSVKFMNINLLDERKMRSIHGMDVIFCRNVLIYFDDKAKQKAVSYLYDSLKTDGFLFVGISESLHNVTRAFKPITINNVVVYQKI